MVEPLEITNGGTPPVASAPVPYSAPQPVLDGQGRLIDPRTGLRHQCGQPRVDNSPAQEPIFAPSKAEAAVTLRPKFFENRDHFAPKI
jgi:hypothetical protein